MAEKFQSNESVKLSGVSEQLVKDVASFSMNQALGTDIEMGSTYDQGDLISVSDTSVTNEKLIQTIPGFAVLQYTPTLPGNPRIIDEASGTNAAAIAFNNDVTAGNSRNQVYEPTDLLMYAWGSTDLFAQIAEHCRNYSLIKDNKDENRYFVKASLTALGYSEDAIHAVVTNIANYREQINVLISKCKSLILPKKFNLLQRRLDLSLGLFSDAPVKRAQVYMFQSTGYFKYNQAKSGYDYIAKQPFGGRDFFYELNRMRECLDVMLRDTDIAIMSADMIKRYGFGEMVFFDSIPEDFHLEVVYDEIALAQINSAMVQRHNLDTCGIYQDSESLIYQGNYPGDTIKVLQDQHAYNATFWDVGKMTKTYTFPQMGAQTVNAIPLAGIKGNILTGQSAAQHIRLNKSRRLVNFYKDDISESEMIYALRMMSMWKTQSIIGGDATTARWNEGKFYTFTTCVSAGTEIIYDIVVTGYGWRRENDPKDIQQYSYYDEMDYDPATMPEAARGKYIIYSKFAWFPGIRITYRKITTQTINFPAGLGRPTSWPNLTVNNELPNVIVNKVILDNQELENCRLIETKDIQPVHDLVSLSAFAIDELVR